MSNETPDKRILQTKKFSSGKGVVAFSERSGAPFPYDEMVFEPGTNLFVHESESDGTWNIVDYDKQMKIPADASRLQNPRPGPSTEVGDTFF